MDTRSKYFQRLTKALPSGQNPCGQALQAPNGAQTQPLAQDERQVEPGQVVLQPFQRCFRGRLCVRRMPPVSFPYKEVTIPDETSHEPPGATNSMVGSARDAD